MYRNAQKHYLNVLSQNQTILNYCEFRQTVMLAACGHYDI